MKKIFILTYIFLNISSASAAEEFYLVDRRGFRSSPTSACAHIFKESHYLTSSCQSVGFQNRTASRMGLNDYQDFVYFFKIDQEHLKDKNEMLFITSYKSSNKSLSLGAFQDLNDRSVIALDASQLTKLVDQKLKLESETDSLKESRDELRSKFESNLFTKTAETAEEAKLSKLIEITHKLHKINFLNEELKNLKLKNQSINNFPIQNQSNLNSNKAKLSNVLKTTIESSLGSN